MPSKHPRITRAFPGSAIALASVLTTGCSFLFVQGPPQVTPGGEPPATVLCTSSMAWPTIDFVLGASSLAFAATLAASEPEGGAFSVDVSGLAAVIWGLEGGAHLWGGVSGRKKVKACREYLEGELQKQAAGVQGPTNRDNRVRRAPAGEDERDVRRTPGTS